MLKVLTMVLLFTALSLQMDAQCNGDRNLCNLRYDQVCFLTTHNAYNFKGDFHYPNQSFPVKQQLEDGVRAFMLDIYWRKGEVQVYHQSPLLGHAPLRGILEDMRNFLDAHPNEVLSIIFESYVASYQMRDALKQSGLLPYLHTQAMDAPWPTLGEMVKSNQRLVVFSEKPADFPFPWYHYVWDYATETDWSNHSRAEFSCAYNRGDTANRLFILNHFITHKRFGYGRPDSAQFANVGGYLYRRALECWQATHKKPNFLVVDFYEKGDAKAVKDSLNATLSPLFPRWRKQD
jgi:hypothetical protein